MTAHDPGRRQRILDFIGEYQREHGYAPSVREITEAVGLSSTSATHAHLTRLRDVGLLTFDYAVSRSVRLTDAGAAIETTDALVVPLGSRSFCRWCGVRKGKGTRHGVSPQHRAWRFWSKVTKSDGCWSYRGYHYPTGYARGQYGGRQDYAHRIAYELATGPIPDGLTIDHLCRNPGCVNPAHLEAVSMAENISRGWAARRNAA